MPVRVWDWLILICLIGIRSEMWLIRSEMWLFLDSAVACFFSLTFVFDYVSYLVFFRD